MAVVNLDVQVTVSNLAGSQGELLDPASLVVGQNKVQDQADHEGDHQGSGQVCLGLTHGLQDILDPGTDHDGPDDLLI